MDRNIHHWCKFIEKQRPKIELLARDLERYGAIIALHNTRDVSNIAYIARFHSPDNLAVTTIRLAFMDYQTESDIVITNITTLPDTEYRKGHGSCAVQLVLQWAKHHALNEVRATQIDRGNTAVQLFWKKNGFVRCTEPNPCNDFVCTLS